MIFQHFYDYKTNNFNDIDSQNKLSEYLHKNKILFCIISELNPMYFPKINYFNENNLITPYHYKRKYFGGVVKIGINKYSKESINVNLDRMILDIMNQYGISENEYVYINSNKINNINTFIIS